MSSSTSCVILEIGTAFIRLAVKSKDCAVVVVENLFSTKLFRDTLLSILLKDLQVSSVSFQPGLFLPIQVSGSNSGIIVDIGERETRCVAVLHGRPLMNTLQVDGVGVDHALRIFSRDLRALSSEPIDPESVPALFRKCAASSEYASRVGADSTALSSSVPLSIRSSGVDALVRGDVCDGHAASPVITESDGVCGLLVSCLKACSHDARAELLTRVVFCGGGSTIPGLIEQVILAAEELASSQSQYSEVAAALSAARLAGRPLSALPSPFLRSNLSWMGGSVFGAFRKQRGGDKFVSLSDLSPDGRPAGLPAPTQLCSASLVAPDWMSLSARDWTFFGPRVSM